MKLIPVKDNPDLARDPITGAIVNINTNEILAARERKQKRKMQQVEFDQLRDDVDNLKSDVGDIKLLLTKLVEKL
jgi:hypothetical protein